jgi:hypothetical protein
MGGRLVPEGIRKANGGSWFDNRTITSFADAPADTRLLAGAVLE